MILSQTTACASKFGDEEAIRLIAQAGFDAVDFDMSNLRNEKGILLSPDYQKYITALCDEAKRNNVFFNQGHALGSFHHPDREVARRVLVERNIRALEIAGLMGIKTLVIHPIGTGDYIGNEQCFFEENLKYFQSLLPYAYKHGVKLACENMWCVDKKKGVRLGSVCSNPYEHAYYVDAVADPMLVACLDVGHSSLSGREAQDCIRVLGKRLGALHIHDNDYLDDMHTLPGLSEMNWDEITKALAEIEYEGDFTLETDSFFDSLCTVEETQCGLKLAELIGRKLIYNIEQYKSAGK